MVGWCDVTWFVTSVKWNIYRQNISKGEQRRYYSLLLFGFSRTFSPSCEKRKEERMPYGEGEVKGKSCFEHGGEIYINVPAL